MNGPEWVFREIVQGQWWEVGELANPKRITHMAGFYDFHYIVQRPWGSGTVPTQLPGITLNLQEEFERDKFSRAWTTPMSSLKYSGGIEPEEHSFFTTSGPFVGYASDPISNARSLREYRARLVQLESEIEVAKDTNDQAAVAIATEEKGRIESELRNSVAPNPHIA